MQPPPQLFPVLVQKFARCAPALLDPLHLAVMPQLTPQLLAVGETHHEALRQFRQCPLAPLIGG
ncbi:MAG: hypothetical protein KGL37_01475 [Acidobacteriota bacterium]|nr:hypothetical protein [Acidobacteriota bacterium]